jgi:hypothetical protein
MSKKDIQHSVLLLTVNTNKTEEKYKSILKKSVLDLMNNIGVFVSFNGKYQKPKIYGIKTTYTIEVSSKGLIHSHILVDISHSPKPPKDRIILNLPYLRKYFNKKTGTNCYQNIRYCNDSSHFLKLYLEK